MAMLQDTLVSLQSTLNNRRAGLDIVSDLRLEPLNRQLQTVNATILKLDDSIKAAKSRLQALPQLINTNQHSQELGSEEHDKLEKSLQTLLDDSRPRVDRAWEAVKHARSDRDVLTELLDWIHVAAQNWDASKSIVQLRTVMSQLHANINNGPEHSVQSLVQTSQDDHASTVSTPETMEQLVESLLLKVKEQLDTAQQAHTNITASIDKDKENIEKLMEENVKARKTLKDQLKILKAELNTLEGTQRDDEAKVVEGRTRAATLQEQIQQASKEWNDEREQIARLQATIDELKVTMDRATPV